MAKQKKIEPTDGFGPKERKRVTSAIRQVWYQSHARKLAVKRCLDKAGFPKCPKCGQRAPHIQIDHITPVGPIDADGALLRMFCPSSELRGLCHECHQLVTAMAKPVSEKTRKRKKPLFCDT